MLPDYYSILQVAPNAEQEIIEAAYRRLAWKYHPDVNKSPDASERMKAINEAYEILSDSAKRTIYDSNRSGSANTATDGRTGNDNRRVPSEPPFVCEGCGQVDASLRATIFLYVISIVVLSFKRGGGGGILCRTCRTKRSVVYTLISLLLGPWGIPWGIFWTLEAVLTNLSGGRQPAEVNGPLLGLLGAYFWSVNDHTQAITSLESSLRFQDHPAIREALRQARSEKEKSRSQYNQDAASHSHEATNNAKATPESRWPDEDSNQRARTGHVKERQGQPVFARPELRRIVILGLLALGVLSAMMLVVRGGDWSLLAIATPTPFPPALTVRSSAISVPSSIYADTPLPAVSYPVVPLSTNTPDSSAPSGVIPMATRNLLVCVDVANFRSAPNTSAPIIYKNHRGEVFPAYGYTGEWFYFGYDKKTGNHIFAHQSVLCEQSTTPAPTLTLSKVDSGVIDTCPQWAVDQHGNCIPGAITPIPRICTGYRLPSGEMSYRYNYQNPPIRGIVRPNGMKIYYDASEVEYWDWGEKGTTEFFSCPAEAESKGFVAAHPQ
ncbi:MAG: DnaJ domain-containing protein [Anaerolineae bacterium]